MQSGKCPGISASKNESGSHHIALPTCVISILTTLLISLWYSHLVDIIIVHSQIGHFVMVKNNMLNSVRFCCLICCELTS